MVKSSFLQVMTRTIRLCSIRSIQIRGQIMKDLMAAMKKAYIFTCPFRQILFGVTDDKQLGVFIPSSGAIILSEELLNSPYEHILSVALHECAHARQYQISGRTAHDDEFRIICRSLGVDEGYEKAVLRHDHDKSVLEKIRKLEALSLSPFEAEAQAALSKARELMVKNHLEVNMEKEEDLIYETDLYIASRIYKKQIALSQMVQAITGVYVISVRRDDFNGIRAYGSKDELEVAGYMWDTLERSIDYALLAKRAENPLLYQGQQGTANFYMGVFSAIAERYSKKEEQEMTKALVKIKNENERKARDIVFSESRISSNAVKYAYNEAVYNAGKSYGSELQIRQGVKYSDDVKAISGK